MALRGGKPDWRSHLLLQRPAQDPGPLSGVDADQIIAGDLPGNRARLGRAKAGRPNGMKILITGICGFTGSCLATSLLERRNGVEIFGIDNLVRPGSERNRDRLAGLGVRILHGDVRQASDMDALPAADWVI